MSVLKTYGSDTDSYKPSKTYRLKDGRLDGIVDELEAVKQAINLMLSTDRFEYEIYSWDYGTELKDLIGKDKEYVKGDIERRITEALEEDDRIEGIQDFIIAFDGEKALVSFTAVTTFGEIPIERGFDIV